MKRYFIRGGELVMESASECWSTPLGQIACIEFSLWLDWRWRDYRRCRIWIDTEPRVIRNRAGDADGEAKLESFFKVLASQVAERNPNVRVVEGVFLCRWLRLIVLTPVQLAANFFLGLLFVWSFDLSPAPGLLVLTVFPLFFLTRSIACIWDNRPHYIAPARLPLGAAGGFVTEVFVAEYEKHYPKLKALCDFLTDPVVLVNGIEKEDVKSFRIAATSTILVFLAWAAAFPLLSLFPALGAIGKIPSPTLMGAVFAIPALASGISYVILHGIFRFRRLSFSKFLHCYLYALTFYVIIEIAIGAVTIFPFREFLGSRTGGSFGMIQLVTIIAACVFWIFVSVRLMELLRRVSNIAYWQGGVATLASWLLVAYSIMWLTGHWPGHG